MHSAASRPWSAFGCHSMPQLAMSSHLIFCSFCLALKPLSAPSSEAVALDTNKLSSQTLFDLSNRISTIK